MVTTERYKYCYYSRLLDGEGYGEELFDLHEDPHEFRDLSQSPEGRSICAGMRARLLEWLTRAEEHRLFSEDDRYPYSTYLRESGRIVPISPESGGSRVSEENRPF
jgi:hypothetical protein